MLGYRIFRHAVFMLIDNVSDALRISLLPFLALGLVTYSLLVSLDGFLDQNAKDSATLLVFIGLASVLVMYPVVLVWVAVGWHRYVLQGVEPKLAWPEWQSDRVWAYAGAFIRILPLSFLLGVIAVVAFLIPATIFKSGEVSTNDGSILGFLLGVTISFLSMRLSLVLPAAALGEFMRVPESWNETKGFSAAIFVVALLVGLLTSIPDFLMQTPLAPVIGGVAYFLVAQWFLLMLGISIMTALYGYIVQQRELR